MKSIITMFLIVTLISCQKEIKKEAVNKDLNYLSKVNDTNYVKKLFRNNYPNNEAEEFELYISNKNDTIINQYKYFKNGKMDTLRSRFYDLDIYETDRPNVYEGKISLFTFTEKFKLSKNEKYTLEFWYWQISEDSTYLTTFKTKQKNNIRFKYTNIVDNNLSGILLLIADNDTIQNGEKMIRIRNIEMLVDNKIKTNNAFLKSFEFHKNYNFSQKK